jgi:glycosyltransferase involved in cell wall biosynthesis
VLSGKDIVCISSLDWHAMWTSKQQIMHRLARSNRILYVEEPVTMLAPLKAPDRWRRWRAVWPRITSVEDGVWTVTPPPVLPFGNMLPLLNRVNQAVIARYIRLAMRRLGFGDYLLWSYLPGTVALVDRLRSSSGAGPALVVYHCVDQHHAFPGFVRPDVVKAYDESLTRRADLVITTSENLRRDRVALNPNTYSVLNAADVDIFARAFDPSLPPPADLAAIPEPRLGVVGLHDSRLDLDAIDALTNADPSWHVVLVGPLKRGQVDEARLRRNPRVHLLGVKPRAELPAYLKGFAVALVPYKVNELTRNVFPLKLFEYLAAGLPVVAGGLPELARLEGTIGLAKTSKDYPELVRRAIASDSPDARRRRAAVAATNSWDDRVKEISGLVEEALRRRARDL